MIVDMHFAGKSAYEQGIIVRTHRPLRPAFGEHSIKIPGRDGAYDHGGGTYDIRGIQVDCIVNRKDLPELRRHARQIAAWLSREGRLSFTDEPDKYYIGRIYDEIMLEQLLTHGQWSILFKVQPMAYGSDGLINAVGIGTVRLQVDYGGTAPTPCRIIIRNNGQTPVSALRITHQIMSGGI